MCVCVCDCRYGRYELTKLIIEKEPQLALTVTAEGYNALHIAVAHKQVAIVKLLTQKQVQWVHQKLPPPGEETKRMESVAKFGSSTMSGHTVLHFAVAVRDQDSLRYMLKYAKELQLSVNANECGYTALHIAVFLNNTDAVQLLLRRGANPNTCIESSLLDKLGITRTPLAEAVVNKNPTTLGLLLDGGAEDRHHDALKMCVLTTTSQELVLPLLGSLVRGDDSHRCPKPTVRERRFKMASVEWANLGLPDLSSSDFTGALCRSVFLRQPGIDRSRFMDYVTSVNLSNNSLSCVPVELFQLSHLTSLNLTNNRLVTLPEVYKQNIGTEVDPYVYPCAALTKVGGSHLYTHTIAHTHTYTHTHTQANFSKNKLSDLPEFLFDLPCLSDLDLSHNELRQLPFKLWLAPKLHKLNASFNSIEFIPTNWPGVLQECTVITSPSPETTSSSVRAVTVIIISKLLFSFNLLVIIFSV